jgi:hypothetical protein
VKEAFRKLVWQYHPDKCAPEGRLTAEAKFKEVGRRARVWVCWLAGETRGGELSLFLSATISSRTAAAGQTFNP